MHLEIISGVKMRNIILILIFFAVVLAFFFWPVNRASYLLESKDGKLVFFISDKKYYLGPRLVNKNGVPDAEFLDNTVNMNGECRRFGLIFLYFSEEKAKRCGPLEIKKIEINDADLYEARCYRRSDFLGCSESMINRLAYLYVIDKSGELVSLTIDPYTQDAIEFFKK